MSGDTKSTTSGSASTSITSDDITLGDLAYNSMLWKDASDSYMRAARKDRSCRTDKMLYKWGRARYELEDYKAAFELFTDSIKMYASNPDVYTLRCQAAYKLGRTSSVVSDATIVLFMHQGANPICETNSCWHRERAYNFRGLAFATQGHFIAALADMNMAILFNPRGANLHWSRAEWYAKLGMVSQAIESYQDAKRLYMTENYISKDEDTRECDAKIAQLEIELSKLRSKHAIAVGATVGAAVDGATDSRVVKGMNWLMIQQPKHDMAEVKREQKAITGEGGSGAAIATTAANASRLPASMSAPHAVASAAASTATTTPGPVVDNRNVAPEPVSPTVPATSRNIEPVECDAEHEEDDFCWLPENSSTS